MNKFLTVVGGIVIVVLACAGVAMLGAYPTMWIVNYLFNPTLLATVFTTAHFTFWHAASLNYIAATLIKSSMSTKG